MISSTETEISKHKNELENLKRQHANIIGQNEDLDHDIELSTNHVDVLTSQNTDVIYRFINND